MIISLKLFVSMQGVWVVSASLDHTVRWGPSSGSIDPCLLTRFESAVYTVTMSRDSTWVACGG